MKIKMPIRKILFTLLAIGLIYTGFLHYNIHRYSSEKPIVDADYLIVLGAKVNGTVPSLALQYRADAAAEYLIENPNTIVVASGGQGPGEEITEAEAISRILQDHGIEKSRIIKESKSTSTIENLTFSKAMLPPSAKKGLIVTNDFHIYRSCMAAKDLGLNAKGLAAKTPKAAVLKSYTREYLAITNYYVKSR
ncbi:YdcF family protein [Metabacillus dongyingensis]|uniref:YdcF family protein n=1 Tax=Metabacillus dongyingensis TaxID=2874282 RepID=UPI003B8C5797